MISIGILLSGCGFYDGTDVAEAVLAALSLERAGGRVIHLSPETLQLHAVDHLTGSEQDGESRDVLRESARLARSRIRSLDEPFTGEMMGLVIPGGHGAVKNLMTGFAQLDQRRELHPRVKELLADLVARRAPIGSISLGRTVVQTFLEEPLSGDDMQMSAKEVLVDEERRLVFTPGFLTGASLLEVSEGIEKMVQVLLRLVSSELPVIH